MQIYLLPYNHEIQRYRFVNFILFFFMEYDIYKNQKFMNLEFERTFFLIDNKRIVNMNYNRINN